MSEKVEKRSYKSDLPFLLAHHPACKAYEKHTIDFRGRKLCMGCFIMYPTAAIVLAALFIAERAVSIPYAAMLAGAIILFAINASRKFLFKDIRSKKVHIAFRALLGASLAQVIMAVWLAPDGLRAFIIVFALVVAVVYNIYNGRRNFAACKTCPQHPHFPRCEGFPVPADGSSESG